MHRHVVLAPMEGEASGTIEGRSFRNCTPGLLGSKGSVAIVLSETNQLHLCAVCGQEVAHRLGSGITVLRGDEEGGGLGHHSGSFGDGDGGLDSFPVRRHSKYTTMFCISKHSRKKTLHKKRPRRACLCRWVWITSSRRMPWSTRQIRALKAPATLSPLQRTRLV